MLQFFLFVPWQTELPFRYGLTSCPESPKGCVNSRQTMISEWAKPSFFGETHADCRNDEYELNPKVLQVKCPYHRLPPTSGRFAARWSAARFKLCRKQQARPK